MSKFSNDYDERVYDLTLDGGYDWNGNVEAPTGWFASVTLDDDTPEDRDAIEHYGTPYLFIVENEQGFVHVFPQPTRDIQADLFALQVRIFELWDADVSVDDALDAYNSYKVVALWSSVEVNEDGTEGRPFDEIDAGFSEQAQASMRDDVFDFIASEADHIRQFLEVTGLGWEQVGHDFWLTRNRHGAGFWDRGAAGPAVDELVESSHAFGESYLYVGDSGEIEVA